jgi:serine/threonine protein kinase
LTVCLTTEIKIGKVLGVGSFGVVREITQIVDDGFNGKSSVLMIDELKPPLNSIVNLPPHRPAFIPEFSPRTSSLDDSNASVTSVVSATSKGTMAKRCIRDGRARYAIKYILKEELTELEIARARIDLAIEVKYLQALDHPNIVKIRGVYDTDDMLHQNFFFLMDRLFGTLEERMKDWQMLEKMSRGTILKIERDKTALSDLLNKKVLVFCDLASAFTYLHSEKVIHRDLKPENVAFDIRGNCKLFDFGLARSMHPDLVDRDDLYRLTGETGSFPYM